MMRYTPFGEPTRLLTRAGAGATGQPDHLTRTPGGHPEGYLEGFANIYLEAAACIRAARTGQQSAAHTALPGLKEGMAGMRFIDACVRSSERNSAWVSLG